MVRIDQLLGGRGNVGEDAEPAEGVLALECPQDVGDRRATHAVKSVAAGDHVAVEPVLLTIVLVCDVGGIALEVVNRDVRCLEQQRQLSLETRRDQVLDDLGLAVDDNAPPTSQVAHGEVVPLALELQVDAVMDDPFALEPLADPGAFEQVDRALLQHAGPDACLDVVATPILEHHGVDPSGVQQLPERQPGRTRADDRDLRAGARHDSDSPSTCCAIANARLAAGTPQ